MAIQPVTRVLIVDDEPGARRRLERLQALYGTNQHLALGPAPGGGVIAHLTLPFHTAADHRVVAVKEQ